jgi:hypothetical protein
MEGKRLEKAKERARFGEANSASARKQHAGQGPHYVASTKRRAWAKSRPGSLRVCWLGYGSFAVRSFHPDNRAYGPFAPGRFCYGPILRGAFGIEGGEFSDSSTQQGVDKLSAGARREKGKDRDDPQTVLADLEGQVGLLGGTARSSDLSCNVPGAGAYLQGTYNLINCRIDLRGQRKVDSKISNTTEGLQSTPPENDGTIFQEETERPNCSRANFRNLRNVRS